MKKQYLEPAVRIILPQGSAQLLAGSSSGYVIDSNLEDEDDYSWSGGSSDNAR